MGSAADGRLSKQCVVGGGGGGTREQTANKTNKQTAVSRKLLGLGNLIFKIIGLVSLITENGFGNVSCLCISSIKCGLDVLSYKRIHTCSNLSHLTLYNLKLQCKLPYV